MSHLLNECLPYLCISHDADYAVRPKIVLTWCRQRPTLFLLLFFYSMKTAHHSVWAMVARDEHAHQARPYFRTCFLVFLFFSPFFLQSELADHSVRSVCGGEGLHVHQAVGRAHGVETCEDHTGPRPPAPAGE
jgi:hypothetical protein